MALSLSAHDYLVRSRLETALRDIISGLEYKTVLDVGAGSKPYEYLFHDCEYISLDLSSADIKGSGESLPIKSESVDLVISTQVLEHVLNPIQFIHEMKRVLKPCGHAIVSTHGVYPIHAAQDYWRWTDQGLREMFAGFDDVEIVPLGGYWLCMFQLAAIAVNARKITKLILPLVNSVGSLDFGKNAKMSVGYVVKSKKFELLPKVEQQEQDCCGLPEGA